MKRLRLHRRTKERAVLLVGAAAGAIIILGLLIASVTVQNGIPGVKGAELNIEFDSVGSVNRFDDVRIAGRRVGGVSAIKYEDGHAVVQVRLQEGVDQLRESTRARVRLAGLIGAQYVELVPGNDGPPLRSGSTIPRSQTSTSPDVFAAMTAFEKEGVEHLRSMIRGLGKGHAGRGEGMNQSFETLPLLLDDAGRLVETLGSDRASLRRLIPAAADFVEAFEPVREEMAEGFAEGERALRPFADDPHSVEALIAESAEVVREIPVEMPKAEPLIEETTALSRAVTRLTRNAPDALRVSSKLLRESPRPIRATLPALRQVPVAIPPAIELVKAVNPLVEPFGRSLESALPGIRESAKRVCDYDRGLPWMRSVVSYGVPAGHRFGSDTVIRVLSGGPGSTGENLGPDYNASKQNRHDEDPPPCQAADQVFTP